MIEINLTPDNFKKKKPKQLLGGFNIPLEVIIGIGGGLLALIILLDVFLVFHNFQKVSTRNQLKKEWEGVLPAKENVDVIINSMRDLQAKVKQIEELTGQHKISWAQKLNILSDSVPRGVWFKKVSVMDDVFIIYGSAISRQKREMINVHGFRSNLNKNKEFLEGLDNLELGSIERRKVNTTEVADFIISVEIKREREDSG